MAVQAERGLVVATSKTTDSYVDWGAIIAGAVLAAAVSLVFLAFGSAIGLTFASPFRGEGMSATGLAIAAALWMIWVQVSGFMVGGYIAGRLRRRIGDATPHEIEVRDGSHGLLVWAAGVVIGAMLAASAVGTAVTGSAAAVGKAADQAAPYVDRLLRPKDLTAETQISGDDRATLGRLFAPVATGQALSTDDRTYVASLVAARTGLSQPEAEARIDAVVTEAKVAADKARKFAILAAFLTAATLLVSAVAAWWAAQWGGHHRDEGTHLPHFVRW